MTQLVVTLQPGAMPTPQLVTLVVNNLDPGTDAGEQKSVSDLLAK